MQRATASVEIDAPVERIWEVLADFGNVSVFNPGVTRSHLTSEGGGGVGATRHCDLAAAGASIEERIVEWVEGESYTIEIYDGTRNPFATALATLSLAPIADDRTTASMQIEWRTKGGIVGRLLDGGMRAQNRKAIAGVLAGLKHHVETGAPVAARQRLDTGAVRMV